MLPTEIEVPVGDDAHERWHILGLAVNGDTVWTTLIAGAIVLALGFWLRRQMTKNTADHIPTKLQIIWESIVETVNKQVEDNIGRIHPFVAPLAIALFFFILIANWLELIPSKINEHGTQIFKAPTADTNLTYALALITIIGVWAYGIKEKGVKGYFAHFLQPFPVLLPLNILEELIKPITLALRLFGNIFAGGIMLALIGGLVAWKMGDIPLGGGLAVILNVLWKLFDMVIGVIQAFIFALLTVLYFAMAGAKHDDHDEHDTTEHAHELAA